MPGSNAAKLIGISSYVKENMNRFLLTGGAGYEKLIPC